MPEINFPGACIHSRDAEAGARSSRGRARSFRGSLLIGLLVLLGGCARSAVPSVTAADFTQPRLSALVPRELELQVTDERPVSEDDRRATELLLTQTLAELFRNASVDVKPKARYRLSVVARQPEQRLGMEEDSCVEMLWQLHAAAGVSTETTALGCAQWRMGAGGTFASVTGAFRHAMELQIRRLDERVAETSRLFAPLEFDPASIEVPRFAWLRPRVLALEVVDELTEDGAAGASLRAALEAAFSRSDLQIVEPAGHRLGLTLRRPTRAVGQRERQICVELATDTRSTTHRGSSSRIECPGEDEPLGARLINGALRAFDEQYGELGAPAPKGGGAETGAEASRAPR